MVQMDHLSDAVGGNRVLSAFCAAPAAQTHLKQVSAASTRPLRPGAWCATSRTYPRRANVEASLILLAGR